MWKATYKEEKQKLTIITSTSTTIILPLVRNDKDSHVDDDLSIESSGTRQSRVEDIDAVRARQHDHVGVCGEAIHLYKQLIKGVLALVIPTPAMTTTTTADEDNDVLLVYPN